MVLPANEQGHPHIVPALAFCTGDGRADEDLLAAIGFPTVFKYLDPSCFTLKISALPLEDRDEAAVFLHTGGRVTAAPSGPSASDRINEAKALIEQADSILRELYDLDPDETGDVADWQSDVWSVSQGLESLDGYLALVLKQLDAAATPPAPASIMQTGKVDHVALTPAQEELIKKYAANFR